MSGSAKDPKMGSRLRFLDLNGEDHIRITAFIEGAPGKKLLTLDDETKPGSL